LAARLQYELWQASSYYHFIASKKGTKSEAKKINNNQAAAEGINPGFFSARKTPHSLLNLTLN
jgi:hypothetical protein